jgi:hypothetical protein
MSTDNRFELKAQKLPEAEYPKEIWFSALNAYREIGLRQGGTTSDRVNAIADAIIVDRERCKTIADAEIGHMLEEYMKALQDADHWHAHVGTLLGIIEQTYDLGDDIDAEDRPAFDQINGEYEARCLEIKDGAAECRKILEKAKARVAAMQGEE